MNIIGTVGFPGSGKSTFVDIAESEFEEIKTVSIGDVVRRLCDTDNVGEFADQIRDQHGNEVFVQTVIEQLNNSDEFSGTVIIDGIRSPEEITQLQKQATNSTVVYISASYEIRRQRISERTDRNEDDLEVRDSRERRWGLDTILEDEMYDVEITNESSLSAFENAVKQTVSQYM